MDPILTEIVSDTSAKRFEQKYASLLVCFDVGSVFSAIASFFRLEGVPTGDDFTVPNLVAATENAFITLLRRGALNPFVKISPLPEAAQAELDAMAGVAEPVIQPDPDDGQAAVSKCVADFRSLDSDRFRRRWMQTPETRSIYELAASSGRL